MTLDLEKLATWDAKIRKLVDRFGLSYYTQEFEICDHEEMLGYMAFSGMPSRYTHWSFGKSFERQKTLYDYGVAGLPYEMVINTDPCVAYLMRDNSELLHVLTIAHVYGHNDFFKNNFTFRSGLDAKLALEMFKNHATRIARYTEDPSIGIDNVEGAIDHAHSLSLQCRRNLASPKLTQDEQRQRAWAAAQPKEDEYAAIHPKKEWIAPDLSRVPVEPEEDILSFIAEYNPYLPDWKRDCLRIVERESKYFVPQMETKIMNEGWASYWHYKLMNELKVDQGMHLEFIVRHNQVLRPQPGGLNPYHLGFMVWMDIERRWNAGDTGREWTDDTIRAPLETLDENDTPGRKKIFEVRETDRDQSFLRRFLTVDLMRELNLFQHEQRGNDRVVTKVADDDNWGAVKDTLLKSVGMGSIPVIKVEDADFGRNRTLYLKHYHEGRDLQLEYAERTLKHVAALWEREVVLETELNGRRSIVKLSGESIKVEPLDLKQ